MSQNSPGEQQYEQALLANPRQPTLWQALAASRVNRKQYTEARTAYENALRLDNTVAACLFGLAGVCREQGDWQEAIHYYRQGLIRDPANVDGLLSLGILLAEHDQRNEAIQHWRTIERLDPAHCQAIHNLGVAFAQNGEAEESVRYLRRALELKPDYAEAHYNLANVLNSDDNREKPANGPERFQKRHEAVEHYQAAIQIRPDYIEAIHNLGSVLIDLQRPAEAAVWLRHAVRLCRSGKPEKAPYHPLLASSFNQLGLALSGAARYGEAERCFRKALDAKPDMSDAHSNLGNLYQEQGRLPEALASYDLALVHDPESATTRWNRSLSLLQAGDFEQGWREYEWRWRRKQTPARPFAQPRWNGEPLDGRTLLIYMEQGLGDMLQFIRFAPLAKARGGRIVVESPGFLLPLLAGCAGLDELVLEGSVNTGVYTPGSPRFDLQIPLMSLPAALGTTIGTIPNQVPYVFVEEDRIERWRVWLRALDTAGSADGEDVHPHPTLSRRGRGNSLVPDGPRSVVVGICWQGNPNHRLDRYRSIALKEFAPLARVPGVRFLSLQKGPASNQMRTLADPFPIDEPPEPERTNADTLRDTAALMKCLDLVIAVDTSVAHLAGAVGVPCWVPLSAIGEWRWFLHRENSPWYPTMRLFRQKKLGAWRPVFKRMAKELTNLVKASHSRKRGLPDSDPNGGKLENASQATPAVKSLSRLPATPLPVQAGHVELSAIASAVDDPGKSSDRLLEIALRAVAHARDASMEEIVGRMNHPPYYPDVWPGEHYKLLAGFMTACKPEVVVEIGTATGLSALAMRSALPKGTQLVTFDLVPWQRFAETHLRQEDFLDPSFSQVIGDLSDVQVMRQHAPLLQSADFIFVDGPKDGHFERILLQRLSDLGLPRSPLIMLDDIRVWNMLAIWREIRRPKLDLTSFGHWSGTGLIDWIGHPD